MNPEIHRNLSFADYRKIEAVNQSSLEHIDVDREGCPLIWKYRHDNPQEKDTDATEFGRRFHEFLLEPKRFHDRYFVEDETLYQVVLERAQKRQAANKTKVSEKFSKNLTEWKMVVADTLKTGMQFITPEQLQQFTDMAEAVYGDEECYEILNDIKERELSIFGDLTDSKGRPIKCKARLDMLTGSGIVPDLKSIDDASPNQVGKSIGKYRYDIQGAFYLDLAAAVGIDHANRFAWIFAGKSKPHQALYWEDEKLIITGRRRYKELLSLINDGRETGKWPGHSKIPTYPNWLEEATENAA